MTDGPDTTGYLTAGGPNEVTLKPHYADATKEEGDPDWYEGTGTYTVSNKSDEVLNVLVQPTLAAAGGASAQKLNLPADAITADPQRVTLHPSQNEQARIDLKVPPQPEDAKAILSVVFKDELRPEKISVSYDSTVTLEKGRDGGSKLWLLLVAIAALVVIGGAIGAFLIFRSDDGGTVPVPEGLVGKTVADATIALAGACTDPQPCLTPTTETEQSSEVGHGLVVSTDPEAGKKVDPGDSVELVVSTGTPVTLPTVEGKNMTNVLNELQGLCQGQAPSPLPCLVVVVQRAASDTISLNSAIKTEPVAGQSVDPGSRVDLYVSNTLKGSMKVPAQTTADIDTGEVGPVNSEADLYYDVNGSELESGYPDGWQAVFLPPITPQPQGYEKCKQLSDANKFENKFSLAELTNGDHFCMRTSET